MAFDDNVSIHMLDTLDHELRKNESYATLFFVHNILEEKKYAIRYLEDMPIESVDELVYRELIQEGVLPPPVNVVIVE